jgi:hypothetical protein
VAAQAEAARDVFERGPAEHSQLSSMPSARSL